MGDIPILFQFMLSYPHDRQASYILTPPCATRAEAWFIFVREVEAHIAEYHETPSFTLTVEEVATLEVMSRTCEEYLDLPCYVDEMTWW